VLIAGLLLFLIATSSEIASRAVGIWHWYDGKHEWQKAEYAKLSRLHSDLTLARFTELLDEPLFQRESKRWTEYVYAGRGYWVQAITRKNSGSVGYFDVTSCRADFKPRFGEIVLRQAKLGDLRRDAFTFDYRVYADSPASLFVLTESPRATSFKSYAWGLNGNCTVAPPLPTRTILALPFGSGPIWKLPARISRATGKLTVDSYAEWGPTEQSWPRGLAFGVEASVAENFPDAAS
jgi:hypothetical protein